MGALVSMASGSSQSLAPSSFCGLARCLRDANSLWAICRCFFSRNHRGARAVISWNPVRRGCSYWNPVWRGSPYWNPVWRGPVCRNRVSRGGICRNRVSRGSPNEIPTESPSSNGKPADAPSPNGIPVGPHSPNAKATDSQWSTRGNLHRLLFTPLRPCAIQHATPRSLRSLTS